jgi:SET domain-containing protein
MPTTETQTPLEIRTVPGKGRGIFAARDLAEGEILEEAPVLLFSSDDAERLEATALGNHYFHWEGDEDSEGWRGALALGVVSLANHSANANAGVWQDYAKDRLVLEALRPIAQGEEILIDYEVELWFDPIEEPSPGTY